MKKLTQAGWVLNGSDTGPCRVTGVVGYCYDRVAEAIKPILPVLLKPQGDNKIYRLIQDKLFWVPNPLVFTAQGLKWQDVKEVRKSDADTYTEIKLFRAFNDPKVYVFTDQGLKKWIQTPEIFNSYNYQWQDVTEVEHKVIDSIGEVDLIRAGNDSKVYKLENNIKRWIKNPSTFNRLGLKWQNIVPFNSVELNAYPEGTPIE